MSNAEWCDAFCRSHGVVGRIDEAAWSSVERTPPHYPDAVTLVSGCSVESLMSRVDAGPGCSIKDSFADLDLSAHGFEVLFAAEWLRQDRGRAGVATKGWSAVVDPGELERWEAAWGEPPIPRPFFRSELLGDARIRILVRTESGRLRSGAVANRSRSAIGLSNLFDVDGDLESAWSGAAGAARAEWGGMPIVGYAGGETLDAARRAGFQTIGRLVVWVNGGPPNSRRETAALRQCSGMTPERVPRS